MLKEFLIKNVFSLIAKYVLDDFFFSFQVKMAQNPWEVESIHEFYFLKCPECDFDTKEENSFENHATENHPLSFVLFDKKYVEEDFDTIDIKEEPLSHYDTLISDVVKKSSMHNQFSPLCAVTEDNSLLGVSELKKEPTDESHFNENEIRNNENYINNSEIEDDSMFNVPELKKEPTDKSHSDKYEIKDEESDINNIEMENYSTDVAIIGNNPEEDPLNSDMKTVHEEKKLYKCWICQKTLNLQELNEHCTTSHHMLRCISCSASFFEKSKLDLHICSVHGRPFKCSICDKSFTTNKGLLCHKKALHEEKKPFQCPYCKIMIPRITDLQEHVKTIHSNYKAVYDKKFAIKEQVKSVHPKFFCSICNKSYSDEQKHVKLVHEGAKLFTCLICNYGFEEEINLKNHIMMIHKAN